MRNPCDVMERRSRSLEESVFSFASSALARLTAQQKREKWRLYKRGTSMSGAPTSPSVKPGMIATLLATIPYISSGVHPMFQLYNFHDYIVVVCEIMVSIFFFRKSVIKFVSRWKSRPLASPHHLERQK